MTGTKLYVGNLDSSVTYDQLEELFSSYGEVEEVTIDKDKGLGFIEMAHPSEAERAKKALNRSEFKGHMLVVDEARALNKGQMPRS
jgi:RNA recognition motif-containing protein